MSTIRPAGITANRTHQILTIIWNDGHQSQYPLAGLRAICPCVSCKGGHANMGGPPDPTIVRDSPQTELNVEQIEPVGSYALQFYWNDGHATGIYTWEYLRAACPCDQCLS